MINIKNFDSNLLNIDKIYTDAVIYNIGHITKESKMEINT